ncbi:MAG: hypothetical protein AAGI66_06060 [Cyanobacteria bacterium P01_H01_bin.74]
MAAWVPSADAKNTHPPKNGKVTLKTVGAGTLSFLIWPGIGQAVNNTRGQKVASHAIIGLMPLFRFWSGYDALVDRHGGYWDGKI